MDIQKLISELQERNRDKVGKQKSDHYIMSAKTLDQITTDTAHQVALAVIEEIKKPFQSLDKNKEYSKPHSADDKVALKCTQVFLNHLKTLEAKIKEK